MDTDNDGLVLRIRYRVEGPDMQNYKCHAAEQSLVRGDTFTPYEQLTETQVIGWIKTALGAKEVNRIETMVNERLIYYPPENGPSNTRTDFPWITNLPQSNM